VILALAVGIALLLPGSPRTRLGLVASRLGVRDVVLLAFGTLAFSHALDSGLVWSGRYAESELSNFARSMQGARGMPLLAAAFAVAIVAPLAEELLCRGLVQRSLAARIGPVPALVLAAVVFGLLHVEPIHAGLAMLLGFYLGVAGWLSASVWVPIACHVLNNAFALGMSVQGGPTTTGTPLHVGVGLALAAAALLLVGRRGPQRLQPAPGSVDG
jgi:membrane protease YdiL (CAAX protease family)